jgi:hypothetical protein
MMDAVTEVSDTSENRTGAIDGIDRETNVPNSESGSNRSFPGATRRRRRKLDKGLLLASLGIALGLVLVIRGLAVGITGDDRIGLPDTIEVVEPVPDAVQVLGQSRVFVDLATGYTGVLVIDGVELETVDIQNYATQVAGRQVELPPVTIFEGGNNTLTFIPNDGAPISRFSTGLHRVQVIYWEIDVGRERARSFSWFFNAV